MLNEPKINDNASSANQQKPLNPDSRNLFERRTIYIPSAEGNLSAVQREVVPPSIAVVERRQTQSGTVENDVLPHFYASLPKLGENANFDLPVIESRAADPHFRLHSDQAVSGKLYLMRRSPALPIQETMQRRKAATTRAAPDWQARLTAAALTLLLLIFGGGMLYYHQADGSWQELNQSFVGAMAATTPTPQAILPAIQPDNSVIARAVVKPLRSAALEMPVNGAVVQIFVGEGDIVGTGQPLLRLEDRLQTLALQEAKVQLLQAQSQLAQTRAGSRPEEIAAAQAALDAAKARLLSNSEAGVRETDVASAQAQLASAQAQLQELLNGPKEATLIEVRAQMQNAEATLQQARSAYNQVSWRSDIGMLPESLAMQKATNEYEAALARYSLLAQPSTPAQLSEARARVEDAKANLSRIQTPAKPADLQVIEAEVRKAEADLQLLQLGARPEEILRAEAAVQAAEVAVLRAQTLLSQTLLVAPFSGLVGDIAIELGEQVTPGKTLIQLGDTTRWRIETSDLTELDIVKVQTGAPARIEIDALPGEVLAGTVSHIRRWGEDRVGDIVYTVEVQPEQMNNRLRWNMTASVTIQSTSANEVATEQEGQ